MTLAGDVLLTSSYLSYVGCFGRNYRTYLLETKWMSASRLYRYVCCVSVSMVKYVHIGLDSLPFLWLRIWMSSSCSLMVPQSLVGTMKSCPVIKCLSRMPLSSQMQSAGHSWLIPSYKAYRMDQDTRGGSIADCSTWTEGVRKKVLRLLDYSVTYHIKRHSNKLTDFVLFSKSHYN